MKGETKDKTQPTTNKDNIVTTNEQNTSKYNHDENNINTNMHNTKKGIKRTRMQEEESVAKQPKTNTSMQSMKEGQAEATMQTNPFPPMEHGKAEDHIEGVFEESVLQIPHLDKLLPSHHDNDNKLIYRILDQRELVVTEALSSLSTKTLDDKELVVAEALSSPSRKGSSVINFGSITELFDKNKESKEEILKTNIALLKLRNENSELRAEKEKLSKKNKKYLERNESLQQDNKSFVENLSELKEQNMKLVEEATKHKSEAVTACQRLIGMKQHVIGLKKHNEQLWKKNRELLSKLQIAKEGIAEYIREKGQEAQLSNTTQIDDKKALSTLLCLDMGNNLLKKKNAKLQEDLQAKDEYIKIIINENNTLTEQTNKIMKELLDKRGRNKIMHHKPKALKWKTSEVSGKEVQFSTLNNLEQINPQHNVGTNESIVSTPIQNKQDDQERSQPIFKMLLPPKAKVEDKERTWAEKFDPNKPSTSKSGNDHFQSY